MHSNPLCWFFAAEECSSEHGSEARRALSILQWSAVPAIIQTLAQAETDDFVNMIQPLMKAHPSLFGGRSDIQFKEWIWAWCTVASRAFPSAVIGETAKAGCLVPVMDLMNHQYGAAVGLEYDEDEIRFTSECGYGYGDEVFYDYGLKSSEDLLIQYGFVLPPEDESTVQGDVVRVILSSGPGSNVHKQNVQEAGELIGQMWLESEVLESLNQSLWAAQRSFFAAKEPQQCAMIEASITRLTAQIEAAHSAMHAGSDSCKQEESQLVERRQLRWSNHHFLRHKASRLSGGSVVPQSLLLAMQCSGGDNRDHEPGHVLCALLELQQLMQELLSSLELMTEGPCNAPGGGPVGTALMFMQGQKRILDSAVDEVGGLIEEANAAFP